MRLMISEVLQKVSNAKTKAEKIALLQEHTTDALLSIVIINYDDSVVSLLPEGRPPYKENDAPKGTEHTVLEKRHVFCSTSSRVVIHPSHRPVER